MSERYLEDPDVRLMMRVRSGDRRAFDELVHGHAEMLVNFCYKFVGSTTAAEDLAQDVFLRVFKAAATYEPTAKFRTWLLTIATNVSLNRRRWQKKHAESSLDEPLKNGSDQTLVDVLAAAGEAPEGPLDRAEVVTKVRAAVLQLPESQRLAVILARYHDLSYAEIGNAMGLSQMAVKSLINRAKENLKVRLHADFKEDATLMPEKQP